MTHFLHRLSMISAEQPDKLAIEFLDDRFATTTRVTYGMLNEIVLQTMVMLQGHGVEPGDRVALQLPKCMPFIYLHLAIMRLGAISLPLNPGYPPRELAYFLEDAGAKLFCADRTAQSQVAPVVAEIASLQGSIYLDCSDDRDFMRLIEGCDPKKCPIVLSARIATCLMIYTSGTTGRPKGAELSYGNLTASLDSLETAWGWRGDDLLLHVLPIFHVHGLVVALHGALHAGASVLMCSKFDPVITLELLDKRHCTVFMAVPTIHRRLVDAPNAGDVDLSHMRLITSGSDRLSDDLFESFRARFGYTLLERYGMSETCMLISNPLEGERRVGSVGLPLPGVEVRIVDPEDGSPVGDDEIGEVQVRGANVFSRYWRQPDKTKESFTGDGWFRTGDLGLREPDGYYTLKGRSKDLIISGGYNVYPPEVELVLAEHPAILASAVIGCPDNEWGERVAAIVVLHPGVVVKEQEIIDFCRQRLVTYKAPRKVVFVDELPRNAMGKVQKADLRRTLCS